MQIADVAAGSLNAVIGILAAVVARKETGRGQHVDLSMLDGVMAFNVIGSHMYLAGGEEPEPESSLTNGGALYDFYRTKDGKYISVGSVEPQFFSAFCNAIGRPDFSRLAIDSEKNDEVKNEISDIIRSRTRDEWVEIFGEADVCVEPVLKFSEAISSQHIKEREMIIELDLPNGGKVRQLANPIRFSEATLEYKRAGCITGTHTQDTLLELGYTKDEIYELKQEDVFD